MAYCYEFDGKNKLVRVTVTELDSYEDQKSRIIEVTGDPKWMSGYNILIDYRDTIKLDLSAYQLEDLANLYQSLNGRTGVGSIAIVTSMNLIYSLSLIWKSMLEKMVNQKIKIFQNMRDAERWLNINYS
jgi:hypothetical protein